MWNPSSPLPVLGPYAEGLGHVWLVAPVEEALSPVELAELQPADRVHGPRHGRARRPHLKQVLL